MSSESNVCMTWEQLYHHPLFCKLLSQTLAFSWTARNHNSSSALVLLKADCLQALGKRQSRGHSVIPTQDMTKRLVHTQMLGRTVSTNCFSAFLEWLLNSDHCLWEKWFSIDQPSLCVGSSIYCGGPRIRRAPQVTVHSFALLQQLLQDTVTLSPQKSRFLNLWKAHCCASRVNALLKRSPDVQVFSYESSMAPYEPTSELQSSLRLPLLPQNRAWAAPRPHPAGSPAHVPHLSESAASIP